MRGIIVGRGEIAAHIEVLCSVAKVPVSIRLSSIGILLAPASKLYTYLKQDRGESGNGRPFGYGFSGIPVRYDVLGSVCAELSRNLCC